MEVGLICDRFIYYYDELELRVVRAFNNAEIFRFNGPYIYFRPS